jgi:NADH-quinone oxidoreductase subunit L
MNFLELIWLIPLLPLCGAVIMLLAGRRLSNSAVSLICPGMVLGSFLISAAAVMQLAGGTFEAIYYRWLPLMNTDVGFLLDPLSSVMILVVSGIGFLIHVYSIGYMGHEGGYYRFFGYMNLFVFFMLLLVLANNYALTFVGWEGVGLCSYLLIGFYFQKKSASDAGMKAFIVNRVGDAGFILGIMLLFVTVGSVRYLDVPKVTEHGVALALGLLFLTGAMGKSAQFPLHVWLPDAMEGPTPVSALIHAATMVTAGVYVGARSAPLYQLAPEAGTVVAIVGAFTAIFAASIALVQNDIKKVLAYSTVSQLGFMFLALGVGAYWVAIFHLFTHAFFKALLFLGSGSVIHACNGEQDMRHMGGLKDKLPKTYMTMLIGTLAIAGVPGLAGFFSKDEILWQAFSSPHGSTALYLVGLTTAIMTAFYMGRLIVMTFFGEKGHAAGHAHESPLVMTGPLMVLAAGSILVGWLGTPAVFHLPQKPFQGFEHFLEPVFARGEHAAAAAEGHAAAEAPAATNHQGEATEHNTGAELGLMALSIAAAFAGLGASLKFGRKARSGPVHATLLNKYYLDEIYGFLFVDGLAKGGGTLLGRFDRGVVDGGVNGAGWLTRFTSTISIWWDTWIVDGAVRLTSFLVKFSSVPVRLLQSGLVQSYALFFLIGVLAVFGFYVTR